MATLTLYRVHGMKMGDFNQTTSESEEWMVNQGKLGESGKAQGSSHPQFPYIKNNFFYFCCCLAFNYRCNNEKEHEKATVSILLHEKWSL